MKKACISIFLTGFAILNTSASDASLAAEQEYLKPYDAIYEMDYEKDSIRGKTLSRKSSDGKGHIRLEKMNGGSIAIFDFVNNTLTSLLPKRKIYSQSTFSKEQQQSFDWMKEIPKAKKIGTRVINSYPCHGYESNDNGQLCRLWVGDNINNVVQSELVTKKLKFVETLKSYKAAAPPSDLFLSIPADYKKMPGAPNP